jgi:hypothetical protein
MSLLYASLLAAVGFVLLIELVGSVRRASRPLDWSVAARPTAMPTLTDRRSQSLPFAGTDRRRAADVGADAGTVAPSAVPFEEPERRAA